MKQPRKTQWRADIHAETANPNRYADAAERYTEADSDAYCDVD